MKINFVFISQQKSSSDHLMNLTSKETCYKEGSTPGPSGKPIKYQQTVKKIQVKAITPK